MLLDSLDLQAFRGWSDVSLPRLAPVSLLVGANNTGKTSVLEAIALLVRPYDPGAWAQVALQRDCDQFAGDMLWSLFPSTQATEDGTDSPAAAKLSISGAVAQTNRLLTAEGGIGRSWQLGDQEGHEVQISAEVTGFKPFDMVFRPGQRDPHGLGPRSYRCCTVTPATYRSTRTIIQLMNQIVNLAKKARVLEVLRLFDPDVDDLDLVTEPRPGAVRLRHAQRGVVDLSTFGDGMRRAAVLAMALVCSSGGVLLVDEWEAGLHPSALYDVSQWLVVAARDADVQIIGTTHSLEAFDAVLGATQAEGVAMCAYWMQRTVEGHRVKRYDGDRLLSLREHGMDLR